MLKEDGSFKLGSDSLGPEYGDAERLASFVEDAATPQATALYRHYDKQRGLLYVGISLCAVNRMAQHRDGSSWYREVARVDIEWLSSRESAIEAERLAIQQESPIHNIVGRKWKPPTLPPITAQTVSKISLVQRVAYYKPMYSISEVAKVLDIRPLDVKRLIIERTLCDVFVDRGIAKKPMQMVTGWQLLDYIESLENGGGKK